MDLKALIAKMDQIESKKILTEAEDRPDAKKKETTWTDKSGKQHPATRVQGSKSVAADKDADKERKKHDKDLSEMTLHSAIAQELLKEFNIAIEEQEIEEAGNPWANDPAKSAAWAALSPEDQKWLGGADPTDPYILARAPNKGKPAATTRGIGAATKPADTTGAPGAQDDVTGVDAAVAAQQASQPLTTPPGAEPDEPQASTLAEPPADDGAATKPADAPAQGGVNPTVINRYKELLDKLEGAGKKPAAAPAAKPAAKPATGAGTKPAAPANSLPGTAVPGGGNIADNPMAEESKLADDQILALIRGI